MNEIEERINFLDISYQKSITAHLELIDLIEKLKQQVVKDINKEVK